MKDVNDLKLLMYSGVSHHVNHIPSYTTPILHPLHTLLHTLSHPTQPIPHTPSQTLLYTSPLLNFSPHTPLTPYPTVLSHTHLSHPPHTPLTHPSLISHTLLTPLSHTPPSSHTPSHTPLTTPPPPPARHHSISSIDSLQVL